MEVKNFLKDNKGLANIAVVLAGISCLNSSCVGSGLLFGNDYYRKVFPLKVEGVVIEEEASPSIRIYTFLEGNKKYIGIIINPREDPFDKGDKAKVTFGEKIMDITETMYVDGKEKEIKSKGYLIDKYEILKK